MADKKTRKTRSDCTVGTFEKKHDFRRELFVIVMDGIPDPIKG